MFSCGGASGRAVTRAAVALQFQYILAGKGVRAGKIQCDTPVDYLALLVNGVGKSAEVGTTGFRIYPQNSVGDFNDPGSGNPHNANAAFSWRRGYRSDSVGGTTHGES